MKLQMAQSYLQQGNLQQAEALLLEILAEEPNNLQAMHSLAVLYLQLPNYEKCIPLFEQVLTLNPNHVIAYLQLAKAYADSAQLDAAQNMLEKAALVEPSNVQNLFNTAVASEQLGFLARSAKLYQEIIAINPDNADAHAKLGVALRALGDIEEANGHFKKAIAINPKQAEAYAGLAFTQKNSAGSSEVAAMEELVMKEDTQLWDKVLLAYGLGKAMEDVGQYEQAFEYMLAANELQSQTLPQYDPDMEEKYFEMVKEVFNSEFINANQQYGLDEVGPIFIVGMPRSGTTLVEQILASHPEVFGAGELNYLPETVRIMENATGANFPNCVKNLQEDDFSVFGKSYKYKLQQLSPGTTYLVDKLPRNFILIGLIKMLLPKAKVIHCTRDPIDTFLSHYKNFFNGDHRYSHTLESYADYYKKYQDLMRYWHSVFPFQLYEINYEQLLNEPEEEVQALLNYCNLPFDNACMEFYKTKRTVATASAVQVRQPLSKDSVNNWQHYEQQLQPLVQALKVEE